MAASRRLGGTDRSGPTPTASGPTPSGGTGLAPSAGRGPGEARVALETVATLEQPLAIAVRPGDPRSTWREGGPRRGDRQTAPNLAPCSTSLDRSRYGGEQGLLGLAFSPGRAFAVRGLHRHERGHDVAEYPVRRRRPDVRLAPRGPVRRAAVLEPQRRAASRSARTGMLYIGARRRRQRRRSARQRPVDLDAARQDAAHRRPRPSDGRPYGIPKDNPFVAGRRVAGDLGVRAAQPVAVRVRSRDTGTCGSATSGRTRGRRSTSSRAGSPGGAELRLEPVRGRSTRTEGSRGPPGSRCRVRVHARRRRSARSPAASSTGVGHPRPGGRRTCSAITARATWRRSSARGRADRPPAAGPRVDGLDVVRGGRRRRALRVRAERRGAQARACRGMTALTSDRGDASSTGIGAGLPLSSRSPKGSAGISPRTSS